MKKIICIVLAFAMLLSVNVTAFAASKPAPVSVSFYSEEPIEVVALSNGYWSWDEDEDDYFVYDVQDALSQEGNSITVTYSDSSKVVYTYDEFVEYDDIYEDYYRTAGFIDSDENALYFSIIDDQDYIHWEEGGTYTVSIVVGRASCEVPITVTENPIASIRVLTPDEESIVIEENTHGILNVIEDEDGYLPYYNYLEDQIICALGNKLEITYKDRTTEIFEAKAEEVYIPIIDYTFSFYGFADESGEFLDVDLFSAQDEEFWRAGEEYIITLSYMGFDIDIPFTITSGSPWVELAGNWYYVVDDIAVKGWVYDNGKWYFFNDDYEMQTGWVKDGNNWYYLKSNGAMTTGWVKDGGKWYYLKSNGAMATGWQKVGSSWYYLKSSGAMATGWLKDGGKWYYLNSNGAMRTTDLNYKGKVYKFNASGVCLNP